VPARLPTVKPTLTEEEWVMTVRHTVLHVEELGQRVLPSASPFSLFGEMSFVQHHSSVQTQPAHALHGSGDAVYTSTMHIPDTGTAYHIQGAGNFGALGVATVVGDIHSVGFILNGHATGTLTFSNARGSVTVELTGPTQGAFASLPPQFHYQITAGTGAYQHLHDQGTLQLQLNGTTATLGATGFGTATIRI
jgi:hypothetical protein